MKKYQKRWFVLFVIVLIVCVWVFRYFQGDKVSTQVARAETYEDKISVNAVFLRDENVYKTSKGGALLERVAGDAKVAKGSYIATVYSDGIDDGVKQEIKEINSRINVLKQAENSVKTVSADLNAIESDIKKGVGDIISLAVGNDLTNLDLKMLCLEEIMKSGSGSVVEETSKQLEQRREQIEKSLNSDCEKIYAKETGIFISGIDGYEEVFSTDKYDEVTLEMIDECIEKCNNQAVGGVVYYNPGDGVCKVSDNTEWMIAFKLAKKDIYGIKSGDMVGVRILGEEEFLSEAKVIKLHSDDGENFICVLKIGDYSKAVYSKRTSEIEIIKGSYTGLAIPAEALRFSGENSAGVYVNDNGIVRFKRVNIMHSDDVVAIVENEDRSGAIRMYDRVILDRDGIYDGKAVR